MCTCDKIKAEKEALASYLKKKEKQNNKQINKCMLSTLLVVNMLARPIPIPGSRSLSLTWSLKQTFIPAG